MTLGLEVLVLDDELAGDERRPLRVPDHRQLRPRGVERAGDDFSAELEADNRMLGLELEGLFIVLAAVIVGAMNFLGG